MSTSNTSGTSPASTLARAQNPRATAAVLEQLAAADNPAVQEAVARHPNTPPRVLWKLARTAPAAVWKNPALGLLAMESPAWMNALPRDAAHALFSHEEAPDTWLRAVVHGSRAVRQAVACNPAAPPEVLATLAADRTSPVHEYALKNPALPADAVLRELQAHEPKRSGYRFGGLRSTLLMHPQFPPGLREALWKGGMSPDGNLFGQNAHPLTKDERERLMRYGRVGRAVVAANPWTPLAQLRNLADDDEWRVRWALAGNFAAPPDLVGTLVTDPVLAVGEMAALHWNLPADTAALIRRAQVTATRSDPERPLAPNDRNALRDMGALGVLLLAGNPGCTPEELRTFAARDEERVLKAVCRNPSTPPDLMARLMHEAGGERLPYAAANPNLPADLLQHCSDADLKAMADVLLRREDLPRTITARFVTLACNSALYFSEQTVDADLYPGRYPSFVAPPSAFMQNQAYTLALYPATSAEQARQIVTHHMEGDLPVEPLLYAAGMDGACSRAEALNRLHPKAEVLLYIAGHDDDRHAEARAEAVAHEGFPPRMRALLLKAGATDDFREIGAPGGALTADECSVLCSLGPFGRRLLAGHPDVPTETLRQLAKTYWNEIVVELAGHPSVPPELWPWLLTASRHDVQRRARNNPNAPAEIIDLLREAGFKNVSSYEAGEKPLRPENVERLLALGPVARRLIAQNRHTSPAVLRALAADACFRTRERVALNENTPADVLDELARTGKALKTGDPEQLPALPEFLRSEDSSTVATQMHHCQRVQDAALGNPGLPPETMAEMAADRTQNIDALASNPSADPQILARLAANYHRYVREKAAQNPSTPSDVLNLLRRAGASDDLSYIERPTASVTASERQRLRELGPFGALLVAVNDSAPPDWNPNGDRDTVDITKRTLAARPLTDEDTLARLVADGAREPVRHAVRHPHTPPYILGFMLGHRDQELRATAAEHPKVPAELLALLRKAGADDELLDPGLRRATFNPKPISLREQKRLLHLGDYGRMLLAHHPGTDDKILHELAHPRIYAHDYREDLLSREALPFRCLERLFVTKSTDPEVFERLRAHPEAAPDLFVNKMPRST